MTSRDHKWDFLRFWVQTLLNHLTFVWCTANRMQLFCKKTQTGLTGWLMESFIFISFARHCNHYSCFVRNRMRYKQFPNQSLSSAHSKPQSFRCNQRNCFICTAKVEITINLNEKAEVKDTKVRKQSGKNLTHFCFFFLSSWENCRIWCI